MAAYSWGPDDSGPIAALNSGDVGGLDDFVLAAHTVELGRIALMLISHPCFVDYIVRQHGYVSRSALEDLAETALRWRTAKASELPKVGERYTVAKASQFLENFAAAGTVGTSASNLTKLSDLIHRHKSAGGFQELTPCVQTLGLHSQVWLLSLNATHSTILVYLPKVRGGMLSARRA